MNSYEEEKRNLIQQPCILLQTTFMIVIIPQYNCFNDENKTARGVHSEHSEDLLTAWA